MRRQLFLLVLFVFWAVSSVQAVEWTDNEDGTWTITPDSLTVPTAEKDRRIQLLRFHNRIYRYNGDKLDTSAWLAALLEGLDQTQAGIPPWIPRLDWCDYLWRAYVVQLHQYYPEWLSSPGADRDVNGENAVIPDPPAAP